ncbi:MAG: copper-containing nitrite reductase [Nitrospira sp.]|nr:copper-containing nitrite reductase [Nitrospira sp.]
MMQKPFSRKTGVRRAWMVALCLAGCPVLSSAETITAQLSTAPNVPPPITRTKPATVVVEMEAKEYVGTIAEGKQYKFWSFNGTVPGPMIRVRVGDTVHIHLTNGKDSSESHNIDFHAVNGPGGGGAMLNTEPGETTGLSFKAINPGLYVYHCATASPSIPAHIANGMYGMILVEPEGGLPPVDKEFYVLQSDFYTKESKDGVLEFDHKKGSAEHPTYVVYNGMAGSLVKNPLTAKAGDKIRIFFGNAGPNLVSSWHIIGEIFDKVWTEGSLTTPPLENVQTTLVPAAGSSVAEFVVEVPGTYISVDHSIFRIEKGALGLLKVEGKENPDVYKGLQ